MTSEPPVDWAAARSEKWRRQLAGLEAMLAPIDAPLITALGLNAPVRVADVGCGSGATTIEVWRRAPSGHCRAWPRLVAGADRGRTPTACRTRSIGGVRGRRHGNHGTARTAL